MRFARVAVTLASSAPMLQLHRRYSKGLLLRAKAAVMESPRAATTATCEGWSCRTLVGAGRLCPVGGQGGAGVLRELIHIGAWAEAGEATQARHTTMPTNLAKPKRDFIDKSKRRRRDTELQTRLSKIVPKKVGNFRPIIEDCFFSP